MCLSIYDEGYRRISASRFLVILVIQVAVSCVRRITEKPGLAKDPVTRPHLIHRAA